MDRSTVVRRALATVAAWYGAVILAYVALAFSLPDENLLEENSGGYFDSSFRGAAFWVGFVYGIPLLLASLLVAMIALAIAVPRVRSGVGAGTLAAFTGFAAAIVVVCVALATLT